MTALQEHINPRCKPITIATGPTTVRLDGTERPAVERLLSEHGNARNNLIDDFDKK